MTCSDLHFRRIIGRRAENGLEVREVMEAQGLLLKNAFSEATSSGGLSALHHLLAL